MTVRLTTDQVLDIHLNYHANGGRTKFHTLRRRHDLTINELYTVLRTNLTAALKKADKGHRFVSWDPDQPKLALTEDEIQNTTHNRIFGGIKHG